MKTWKKHNDIDDDDQQMITTTTTTMMNRSTNDYKDEQTINKWLLRQQWQWWNDQQMITKKQWTNHQQTITMTTRWSTCMLQNENEDNDSHDDCITMKT